MATTQETVTLKSSLSDASWSHWVQGRGRKAVSAVVQEGLDEIRKSAEAREKIKRCCEAIAVTGTEEAKPPRNTFEIELPAADWGEACQLVGTLKNDKPVTTSQLLAALILESESWQQRGNATAEFLSGWNLEELVSSVASTELTQRQRLRLGDPERRIAWIVAVSSAASAVAAWLALCK